MRKELYNRDDLIGCIDKDGNKTEGGGRMYCRMCGSLAGFKSWKYRRGNDYKKWFDYLTCVNCGKRTKIYCFKEDKI